MLLPSNLERKRAYSIRSCRPADMLLAEIDLLMHEFVKKERILCGRIRELHRVSSRLGGRGREMSVVVSGVELCGVIDLSDK